MAPHTYGRPTRGAGRGDGGGRAAGGRDARRRGRGVGAPGAGGPVVGGALGVRQGVEQLPRLGQLLLDGALVPGDGLAAPLQFGELAGGLLALLGEVAHGALQFLEFAGLAGGDPVEHGGLVEVVVGVVGEHQREGGVDAARAVLGPGERTERVPHGVDAVLLPGDPVLRPRPPRRAACRRARRPCCTPRWPARPPRTGGPPRPGCRPAARRGGRQGAEGRGRGGQSRTTAMPAALGRPGRSRTVQGGDGTPRVAALPSADAAPGVGGNAADSSRATTRWPKTRAGTQRDAPPETQVIGGAWGQRELPGIRPFGRRGDQLPGGPGEVPGHRADRIADDLAREPGIRPGRRTGRASLLIDS